MKKNRNKRILKKFDSKNREKKKRGGKVYTGVFSASRDGYGFITADPDQGDFTADVFVPARFVKDAVSGDRVRFTTETHDGKLEAHVTSVAARSTVTFTGTYRYISRREGNRLTVKHLVIPDDKKLSFDTLISPKHLSGAVDGDKVLCEIVTYPDTTNQKPAYGNIIRTYGSAEELYPNVFAALDGAGIRTRFPDEVTAEAETLSKRRVLKRDRLDLREEKIFTIDGAGSKDMDDAISVKRKGDGFELGVHIADVSEYVKHGSLLDDEAFLRGTSVYFADRVIPMLPQSLSNGACSLNPGVGRYTLSAFIDVDRSGEITGCTVRETVIRSRVRGVYSEVNDVIENGEKSRFYKKYKSVFENGGLEDLISLYEALDSKSRRRHALQLDSAETGFTVAPDGTVTDAFIEERGMSERMIEQFMLAANEGVATLLKGRGLPCVYRIHETPDPEKIKSLRSFAESIGVDASALDRDEITLQATEKFLDAARDAGKGEVMSYMVLRCMMKARYESTQSPHYGLGAECYCHFTSPIRRYPDLVVHRIIKTLLLHGENDRERVLRSYTQKAAERSTECEDTATKLERDMDSLYMAAYMKDKTGSVHDAVITGVTQYGFFARIGCGAEGFVRLGAVNVEFIPSIYALITPKKTYRMGDPVTVRVADVSLPDRRIDFELVRN